MGNYLNQLFRSPKIYTFESYPPSHIHKYQNKNSISFNRFHQQEKNINDTDRLLRLKILDDIPIFFPRPTIILLFAPPDYGIETFAETLSRRVNLPVLKAPIISDSFITMNSFERAIDYRERQEYDRFDTQLMTELEGLLSSPQYARGCIMYDYPTSPKHYRFLCEISNAQQIPLFFDMDPQVPLTLRHNIIDYSF